MGATYSRGTRLGEGALQSTAGLRTCNRERTPPFRGALFHLLGGPNRAGGGLAMLAVYTPY